MPVFQYTPRLYVNCQLLQQTWQSVARCTLIQIFAKADGKKIVTVKRMFNHRNHKRPCIWIPFCKKNSACKGQQHGQWIFKNIILTFSKNYSSAALVLLMETLIHHWTSYYCFGDILFYQRLHYRAGCRRTAGANRNHQPATRTFWRLSAWSLFRFGDIHRWCHLRGSGRFRYFRRIRVFNIPGDLAQDNRRNCHLRIGYPNI